MNLVDDTVPRLHLYLLAGQSNMAGRGQVQESDTIGHERILALRSDMTWGPAAEPLHFDKPERVGVGPGMAFARALAEEDTSVAIGLIPAAVGGSEIAEWVPGGEHHDPDVRPYDDAVSRVFRVLAMYGGELKGIVWHQGESDRDLPPAQYLEELALLVERFRTEFRKPDLPFVAGELGYFYTAREPGAATINEVIAGLPERVPNTAVVTAEGLSHKGDSLHFDARSARLLGQRYAAAMRELQSKGS